MKVPSPARVPSDGCWANVGLRRSLGVDELGLGVVDALVLGVLQLVTSDVAELLDAVGRLGRLTVARELERTRLAVVVDVAAGLDDRRGMTPSRCTSHPRG